MDNILLSINQDLEGFSFSYRTFNPEPDFKISPRHVHSFYEMIYVDDGEVEFVVESRKYVLKRGDVLIIKPAEYHYARFIYGTSYSRYCLGFSQDFVFDKNYVEQLLENGEKFSVSEGSAFFEMAKILKEKAKTESEYDTVFYQSLLDAMLLSLEEVKPDARGITTTNTNFQKILRYVNLNLTSINSIDDISKAIFFSKSCIMHLFKSELHVGVMQYIRNKKILLAHQKIRKGEKPTEVYATCGFSNYPSFYRAYTAYFGSSPKCAKNLE